MGRKQQRSLVWWWELQGCTSRALDKVQVWWHHLIWSVRLFYSFFSSIYMVQVWCNVQVWWHHLIWSVRFRVAKCQFFYTEQNLQTKFYPKKRWNGASLVTSLDVICEIPTKIIWQVFLLQLICTQGFIRLRSGQRCVGGRCWKWDDSIC